MPRKQYDPDAQAKEALRTSFVQIGRALSLTFMAANLPPGSPTEDEAIGAMDLAWVEVADRFIGFLEAE